MANPILPRSEDESKILQMFRYMRPSGSVTEQAFVDRYLGPLGFKRDAYDNLVLVLGDAPFLFSSHMDTVHREEGFQTLHLGDDGILKLSKRSRNGASSCLGADDTAGIWLMTEMVKAGVSGTYVIHHGEESGCIGSSALAKGDPMWLSQFRFAMAFDRAYQTDVITHQMGRRTCSDAFAKSLCAALGGKYKPDDGGAYTDTNEYAQIIPECTNISVGYRGQHSRDETQDVPFLIALRDTLVAMDFHALVIDRDPTVVDEDDYGYGNLFWGRRSSRFSGLNGGDGDLRDAIEEHPDVIVSILEDLGVDAAFVWEEINRNYGFKNDRRYSGSKYGAY